MKPIKYNDTGPAVEDIQRRLRVLGYTIGAEEGTSGTFQDETLTAVTTFQRTMGLSPTGAVGPRTWSRLVDSTFELGDRMLYLRMPYFHGADVTQLQHALNSLGFVTGGVDGIFGAGTERAVTEFQQNYDINPDGLVGPNTLRALLDLHHIWGGKEGRSHSSSQATAPQQYQALMDFYFDFQAQTAQSTDSIAPATLAALRRLVRYANNLEDAARTDYSGLSNPMGERGSATTPATTVLVSVSVLDEANNATTSSDDQVSVVYEHDFKIFSADLSELSAALQAAQSSAVQSIGASEQVPAMELQIFVPSKLLEPGTESSMPVGLRLMASRLLDALCLAAIG